LLKNFRTKNNQFPEYGTAPLRLPENTPKNGIAPFKTIRQTADLGRNI